MIPRVCTYIFFFFFIFLRFFSSKWRTFKVAFFSKFYAFFSGFSSFSPHKPTIICKRNEKFFLKNHTRPFFRVLYTMVMPKISKKIFSSMLKLRFKQKKIKIFRKKRVYFLCNFWGVKIAPSGETEFEN